jgi:cyclohexanone monooxygenase
MKEKTSPTPATLDAVIVGAGFAGMYTLHRLRSAGLSTRVFEAGGGVGGTWYWNRYPGARCDVESVEYGYSFSEELQQEWEWSERYSTQPEIERYANHVADRFDLRRDIQFNTRVTAAHFSDETRRWRVTTDRGDTIDAQFLIMATGCLSNANTPDFPGLATFTGTTYHTGRWPHEPVDFTGKRVGVIGTGSSAVQSIPIIAEQAAELYVFQRTASYSLPSTNGPLDPAEVAEIKAHYPEIRAANQLMPAASGSRFKLARAESILEADPDDRARVLEAGWTEGGFSFLRTYPDVIVTPQANKIAADFIRAQIRSIVRDPATAELLSPRIPVGCKRIIIDTNYYETFNLPNVHLVDIKDAPIQAITPTGLRTADASYDLDAIVFATGFDAMTGALLNVDIRGRSGASLRTAWAAGPRTYLGLGIAGFPNLFTISGPGSPSVLTNMIISIEQHVNWITECVDYMRRNRVASIEATPAAQEAWVEHVNAVAGQTIFTDPTCNSWYLGANIPGKARVFMPLLGYPPYVEKCNQVAAAGYEGFELRAER